jgi:hypothetical protein
VHFALAADGVNPDTVTDTVYLVHMAGDFA